MLLKKYLSTTLLVVLCFATSSLFAQGLMLRNFNDESKMLDRYEIMSGELSKYFYGTHKNVSAKNAINFLNSLDSNADLTRVDAQNIKTIISNNFAAITSARNVEQSKKGILKAFYTEPRNMVSYSASDGSFMVSVNPIIQYTQLLENNNTDVLFLNQKGLDISARILNKITIHTAFTDNQERNPSFATAFIFNQNGLPGAGYKKDFNAVNGWDYTLANGYVSADIVPNAINATFGHGQFFIGDGKRSLFLSDFGTNMLFLKTNWRFWKINYQTLLLELNSQNYQAADGLRPKKYGAMHHLGFAINKKLNIGVFEAVMFGRKDKFEFQYLNPLVFYRTIEQQLGSPDNALLGADFKYLAAKNIQLYGQLMLDEFRFGDVLAGNKHWANKQAYQLGVKYINAFGIKNLDMQLEHNNIRPFTYSYADSLADYTSYNLALAHPNGANLREQLLEINYQPMARLQINLETIYRQQGMDTSNALSNGGNIFKSYILRDRDTDYANLGGVKQNTFFTNLNASYNILSNIYLDAGLMYRTNKLGAQTATNSTTFYIGARLNAARKRFNY